MKKRNTLLVGCALALVLALLVGGTLAYLYDSSDVITNTFTTSHNSVDLSETKTEFTIIPGAVDTKDPVVTATWTLDSYVFVVVTDHTDDYVTWSIADGWKVLDTDGDVTVYYRLVTTEDGSEGSWSIIADNTVSYPATLTNADMEAATEDITLSFQAYIMQCAGFESAWHAWTELCPVEVSDADSLIEAAAKGGSIVLTGSITSSSTVEITSDAVIDLNGYSLTVYSDAFSISDGADVTITNGVMTAQRDAFRVVAGEDGTGDNTVVISDCTITSLRLAVASFCSNNTIIVSGCTITSATAHGIYQNGSYEGNTIIVSDTTITSDECGIYISNTASAEKHTLTVSNVSITSGNSAIEVKHTNATITDSNLFSYGDQESFENGNGECTVGYSLAVTSNSADEEATGVVTVTGCNLSCGTFIYKGATVTIDGTAATCEESY